MSDSQKTQTHNMALATGTFQETTRHFPGNFMKLLW